MDKSEEPYVVHSHLLTPTPRSALPPRLLDGSSKLHVSVGAKERERLAASIENSNRARMPIDFGISNGLPADGEASQDVSAPHRVRPQPHSQLIESPRDPRDDKKVAAYQPTSSRPASPYTLNPPIDFDGLSWPSKLSCVTSAAAVAHTLPVQA